MARKKTLSETEVEDSGEDNIMLDSFEKYYNMSPRSLSKLAKEINVPEPTLFSWSRRYHWKDRIDFRNYEIEKETRRKLAKERADMNLRHRNEAYEIQQKCIDTLRKMDFRSFKTTVDAYKMMNEIERTACGFDEMEEFEEQQTKNEGSTTITIEDLAQALEKKLKKETGEFNKQQAEAQRKDLSIGSLEHEPKKVSWQIK